MVFTNTGLGFEVVEAIVRPPEGVVVEVVESSSFAPRREWLLRLSSRVYITFAPRREWFSRLSSRAYVTHVWGF